MIANHNIRLALLEIFLAFHGQRATNKREENIHPYLGYPNKDICFLRVITKIAEQKKRYQKNEHGHNKSNQRPCCPYPSEYFSENFHVTSFSISVGHCCVALLY